jgi:hypothetical protein
VLDGALWPLGRSSEGGTVSSPQKLLIKMYLKNLVRALEEQE